jgi:hypothetical protein
MAGGSQSRAPASIDLEQALVGLTPMLADCRDPWAIFGGAALHLHGHGSKSVADIDILVSIADGERMAASGRFENIAGGGTDLFRSQFLFVQRQGRIPVEIMAGFEIRSGGQWQAVKIGSRVAVHFGAATVPVANLDDIRSILALSGREKDLRRLSQIDGHT